jgi:hypothetical protein
LTWAIRRGNGEPLVEIVKFFRGGPRPVSAEETVELFAFREAADERAATKRLEVRQSFQPDLRFGKMTYN